METTDRQQKYCCKWGGTEQQSAAVRYQQPLRLTKKAKQKFYLQLFK